jgi:uncharacterized OB-fold protein
MKIRRGIVFDKCKKCGKKTVLDYLGYCSDCYSKKLYQKYKVKE